MRYGSFLAGLVLGAALVAAAWAAVPPPPTGGEVPTADRSGSGPPPAPAPGGRPRGASEAELDTETLMILAERDLYVAHDAYAACRVLERVLARDLEPDERLRALTHLGAAQRSLGAFEASVATLEKVLEVSGIEEERGAHAGFQLMWTQRLAGDLRSAIHTGEALVAQGRLRSGLGAATHRALGLFAREVGDIPRSRQEFERALEVSRDDPNLRNFREEILGWLHAK